MELFQWKNDFIFEKKDGASDQSGTIYQNSSRVQLFFKQRLKKVPLQKVELFLKQKKVKNSATLGITQ